ncbi:MAG TPA: carbohydrate porin [Aliidongia sp.]|uniref:carbohydrate porin n=1 Tax=Aliidongia sp. TaxID=1914230 RepID=UPI002DDC9F4A|nr:carbohydrate porin [Aliidongia sp.]HEV2677262.1 carbohydrate porin [Aliidongia sp.]
MSRLSFSFRSVVLKPGIRTVAAGLALGLMATSAIAAPPQLQAPTEEDLQNDQGGGLFGFTNNLTRSGYLLGDMWGLRSQLAKSGITFALSETSEILGNVTGGAHHGFDYDGLTQMAVQLDTKRAFGWYGGTFNASALQIHGRNLSADNLDSLQTSSGIESDRATRLWELWYQQKFLDEDRLDVKIGQQSLDQEFMVSQNALLFVNTMFGWPMVPSADLPGGGPAYPLSALGIRVRAKPTDSITVLAGLFNGSPVNNPSGDPQMVNASGTTFATNGGGLAIAEVQYAYPSLGTMLYADQVEPLARTYRLGVWYDTERFGDQRYDSIGRSQASPGTSGLPATHRGDYGIYGVVDQMLWVDEAEPDRSVSIFARVMGTPEVNRNLIAFSANLGLNFKEPFLGRDDDTFGIGMGYAKVSSGAAGLDRDTQAFGGGYTPTRSNETYVEATYQYSFAPWLQLQPDVQYVMNPGGGVANPTADGQRIKNELVVGLRTNILF